MMFRSTTSPSTIASGGCSNNMLVSIFTGILGLVSIFLFICSSVLLLLCNLLLTCSRYIETIRDSMTSGIDLGCITNDMVQTNTDNVNHLLGRTSVSNTVIKSEFADIFDRDLTQSDDLDDGEETDGTLDDVSDDDSDIEDDVTNDDSDNDDVSDNDVTIDNNDIDDEPENDVILDNNDINDDPDNDVTLDDNDIEDVTESMLMKIEEDLEATKVTIDLSEQYMSEKSENDDVLNYGIEDDYRVQQ